MLPAFMDALARFGRGQAPLLLVRVAASLAMFAALALPAWNLRVNVEATAAATWHGRFTQRGQHA